MALFLTSLPWMLLAMALLALGPVVPAEAFRRASHVAGALAASTWIAAAVWAWGGAEAHVATAVPDGPAWLAVRIDLVTWTMLALVQFLGFIILRYSGAYLAWDPRSGRYMRWLCVTLAAVDALVITDHLLVAAGAWLLTSLSLHRLLLHFAERPAAQLAAHKKFLASRAADLALFGAVALIYRATGSLSMTHLASLPLTDLPGSLQAAALLLVACAALKTAQLPFHGWITQVMEAPTPVSALLHAGVVNIGGFLMIRFAPLMTAAPLAQTVLVAIGCTTAVIAGFVMTTRVSVKVMLAWSTIAQMGFMLVQCGLGAYAMALLHIVAHSLYKGHAFLSSGSAVEIWRAQQLARPQAPPSLRGSLGAAGASVIGVAAAGALFGADPRQEPALWALLFVLALALTPLLARRPAEARGLNLAWGAAFGVAALSLGWHALLSRLVETPPSPHSLLPRLALVIVAFGGAFLVQAAMDASPRGWLARTLQPRLFAGFHLDERFTRLVLRVWPPRAARER